ncbi:MAG TPA: DUF6719 family protein [Pseudorhodoplanes sp.]|jgi:hypothetical protein|nr:DUF6719 family protein [Pseudorhodoplanes sp.]
MSWVNTIMGGLLICAACALFQGTADAQQVLKREPAMGAMREGERVLVDDGTCPGGQIKEVIGGNHVKVGGTKKIERTRRCIKRR